MRQGAVDYPDLTPRQRRSGYAFDYSGLLKIPASGLYQFTLRSCSGAILLIDGQKIVDGDGHHSPADANGWAALQSGTHAVELRYYFDAAPSLGGGFADGLSLSYEGPGIATTPVPVDAWFRVPAGVEPRVALKSPVTGSTVPADKVDLEATADAGATTLEKVEFYLDDLYLGEKNAAPYSIQPLLGLGPNRPLRARFVYDHGTTFDSAVSATTIELPSVSPWQLNPIGDRTRPAGAILQDGVLSLTGDGLNLLTQPIEGDCTIVAHLAEITSAKPLPDGSKASDSWAAGIILRTNLEAKPGSELGEADTRYAAIYGTVDGSTRFQDVSMAGNGGHYGSKNLGRAQWFKLERVGNAFTSSISVDGTNWTIVNTKELDKIPAVMHAGVFTYAPTSGSPATHHASFDHVSLTGTPAKP